MQGSKTEIEKLRGDLEEEKKNKGQDEDTQAKGGERMERDDREEKLEWELELVQRRSRRRNVIIEGLGAESKVKEMESRKVGKGHIRSRYRGRKY